MCGNGYVLRITYEPFTADLEPSSTDSSYFNTQSKFQLTWWNIKFVQESKLLPNMYILGASSLAYTRMQDAFDTKQLLEWAFCTLQHIKSLLIFFHISTSTLNLSRWKGFSGSRIGNSRFTHRGGEPHHTGGPHPPHGRGSRFRNQKISDAAWAQLNLNLYSYITLPRIAQIFEDFIFRNA